MSRRVTINGMICAPYTPFNKNGEVNVEVLPYYVKALTHNGMEGAFINGSTGEGLLLTVEERMLMAEQWVKLSPQSFKIIIHVGSNSTKTSNKLASHAQDIGAWGISAMGPTFPPVKRIENLVRYCEQVASGAPDLPFYYYHIPALSRLHLPMLPFLTAVDERISSFAGIKYTYENLYEYIQCCRYKNGKFDILHGQDETLLASLSLGGATGCIGGTFNYAAPLYLGIRSAFEKNDLAEARKLQHKSMDLIDIVTKYHGNTVSGKQIMKFLGLDLGPNRAPFQQLTAEDVNAMKTELEAINFFQHHTQIVKN